MRSIQDITADEIKEVNSILLKNEVRLFIADAFHLYYNLFKGNHPRASGLVVVTIYEYLRSVNIDVSIPWDEHYAETDKD